MIGFTDLAGLEEDNRIEIIGSMVMNSPRSSADQPLMIAFIVEDDEKADRYVSKLRARWPNIRIIDRVPGPVKDTVAVRVGAPLR